MCCNLNYIPERLHHTDDRAKITTYQLNDIIYRRVNRDILTYYGNISLYDLSHNIGTNNGEIISYESDVLFSIREDEDVQSYDDKIVISLSIVSLTENNTYDKVFHCEQNQVKARCLLDHDPVSCMHPHSVFRFFVIEDDGETEVTADNYKKTLGHKKYKHVRDDMRVEITGMIIKQEISQNPN